MVRRAARPSGTVSLHLRRLSMATETPYVSWRRRPAMFEEFSKSNKAVRTALELAAEGGWSAVTFAAIAERNGLKFLPIFAATSPASRTCSRRFKARSMARSSPRRNPPALPSRARATACSTWVMTRLEVMAPYKPALRRTSNDLCCHPAEAAQILPSSLASQYWMLARRRRQAGWSWCWSSRRGSRVPNLRQGVSRLARR